jgi:hypothetical protein
VTVDEAVGEFVLFEDVLKTASKGADELEDNELEEEEAEEDAG